MQWWSFDTLSFNSDNWAGAHPAVLAALAHANEGGVRAYGNDETTARAEAMISAIFETHCSVYFVATGTAANGLSLAALCPPWGAVLCHRNAHIAIDEGGGPEFFTSGARLLLLDGETGKLTPQSLSHAARRFPKDNVHSPQPRGVSVTNATESGTTYSPAELAALSRVCKAEGWGFHVDGARFANALAFTGASPAELSWKSGVDILSFGLTKAGALCCEAVVVFNPVYNDVLPFLRKRSGQLFSKHRAVSAQAVGLLQNSLWLELAQKTNALALRLAKGLQEHGADLLYPVEANEVFVRLSPAQASALENAGVGFYAWPPEGEGAYRFVVGWPNEEHDVAKAISALALL